MIMCPIHSFSRKDGLIVQNHLFENDSFSLSSLGPPIIMSHLLEVLARSSLYSMIHRDNDSIFHPLRAWINPFVIVFNLPNALYILSRKCWIPKTKISRILNKKHQNTLNMFSNDDYEFEDLANQISQTQLNESGNIGGLSML